MWLQREWQAEKWSLASRSAHFQSSVIPHVDWQSDWDDSEAVAVHLLSPPLTPYDELTLPIVLRHQTAVTHVELDRTQPLPQQRVARHNTHCSAHCSDASQVD